MKTGRRIIRPQTSDQPSKAQQFTVAQHHLGTPPAVQEAVALESETVEERMTSKLQRGKCLKRLSFILVQHSAFPHRNSTQNKMAATVKYSSRY